jgi:electron transfer flavoprotein beta subunit
MSLVEENMSLKILALIKYSLDVAEIKVDPPTRELRMAGVPSKIGNIDRHVIEAAVQLKEAQGGSVQALCFGPAEARESFREALAIGIDEVTLVEEPAGLCLEAPSVVKILEASIRKLGGFDLIVCGEASDDGFSYQVGPRLAERLGLPLISFARQISIQDGRVVAERDLGKCLQSVRAPLPALISITEESNRVRRTTLLDALKAKKKPVNLWSISDNLGISLPAFTSEAGVIEQKREGILVQRKQQLLRGADPAQLADRLIDFLLEAKVLKEGR